MAGDQPRKTKTFTIEFWTGSVGADGRSGKVGDILQRLADEDVESTWTHGLYTYELRNVAALGRGTAYRGVLAKFRVDDLPHAGSPGGSEREIDLDDEEGLIEKNHFIYFRKRSLLVYQRNRYGGGPERIATRLTDIHGDTVVFNPVLQPEAVERMMRGDVQLKSLRLSFARPTNRDYYPSDKWARQIVGILGDAGGVNMHLRISGDARSGDPSRHHLLDKMKRSMAELVGSNVASLAQLDVEDDGSVYPIDLIADRLLSRKDVEMDGRYPVEESIYASLERARKEQAHALGKIFGEGDNVLI